jgi:hypothetical protein
MAEEPLVFDPRSGTIDHVYRFLDTLNCPHFQYSDVLYCYSEFVGKSWTVEDGVPRRAPRIPTYVETLEASPPAPSPASVSDSDSETSTPDRKPGGAPSWTKKEDTALLAGISEFGFGKWAEIIDHYPILTKNRTYGSIKSRAVRLKKHGKVDAFLSRDSP